MRINPTHENTCTNRIGMYRANQCTDGPHVCPFLSECETHYDEETGDWDYQNPLDHTVVPTIKKSKYAKSRKGAGSPGRTENRQRRYRVEKGLEKPFEITTSIDEALKAAGLR